MIAALVLLCFCPYASLFIIHYCDQAVNTVKLVNCFAFLSASGQANTFADYKLYCLVISRSFSMCFRYNIKHLLSFKTCDYMKKVMQPKILFTWLFSCFDKTLSLSASGPAKNFDGFCITYSTFLFY